jgi:hypothetical protein
MINSIKEKFHTGTRDGESTKGLEEQTQVAVLNSRETKAKEHELHRLEHELNIAQKKDVLKDEDASGLLKAEAVVKIPLHGLAAGWHKVMREVDDSLSHGPQAPKSVESKLLRKDVDIAEQEWLASEKRDALEDPRNTNMPHKVAAGIRLKQHQNAAQKLREEKEKEEYRLLSKEIKVPASLAVQEAEKELQSAQQRLEQADAQDYVVKDPDQDLPVRTVIPPPPAPVDTKAAQRKAEKQRLRVDESGKGGQGGKPEKKAVEAVKMKEKRKARVAQKELEQPQPKDRAELEREAKEEDQPIYQDAKVIEHELIRAQHNVVAQQRTDVALDPNAPAKARVGGLLSAVEHKAVADVHQEAELRLAEREAEEAMKRWREEEEKLEAIRNKPLEMFEAEDRERKARAAELMKDIRERQIAVTQHELAAKDREQVAWDPDRPILERLGAAIMKTGHDLAAAYHATAKEADVKVAERTLLPEDVSELAQATPWKVHELELGATETTALQLNADVARTVPEVISKAISEPKQPKPSHITAHPLVRAAPSATGPSSQA